MRIRYVEPADPLEDRSTTVFGITFNAGEWVDLAVVTDDDARESLVANPRFETDAAAPAPEAAPEPVKPAPAVPAQEPAQEPAQAAPAAP